MRKLRTSAIVSGMLSFAFVAPAFGQADGAAEEQQLRERLEQENRAIEELFRDLKLQAEPDDAEEPLERIEQQRRRVEELHRRVIELRLDQLNPIRFQQRHAAEPIQIERAVVTNPWAKRSRSEVIAALDHAEYAVRESAEAFLLTDNTLDQETISRLIKDAATPEQRQRLLRVAEHHVMRAMRERDFGKRAELDENDPFPGLRLPASVGYSYEPVLAHENPQADLPGVRVNDTMPGFPGHAHLRRNDIIVQINGVNPSPNDPAHIITEWVGSQIRQQTAGDTIDFTVLRDGKALAVEMVCAQGTALDHMYATNASATAARKEPYRSAWRDAREQLIAEMPKAKTLTPIAAD